MKLEDQVVSLELAKKLKELGVKQESYFKYEERENGHVEIYHSKPTSCAHKYYSALTVAELGEMLHPRIVIDIDSPFNSFRLHIEKSFIVEYKILKIIYIANYRCDSTDVTGEEAWMVRNLLDHNVYDENMSNCLAKLLIQLIENKIIDA